MKQVINLNTKAQKFVLIKDINPSKTYLIVGPTSTSLVVQTSVTSSRSYHKVDVDHLKVNYRYEPGHSLDNLIHRYTSDNDYKVYEFDNFKEAMTAWTQGDLI